MDRDTRRFIICGDDALTHRLVNELTTRYGVAVTVVMPSRRSAHGAQIAATRGVRVVEAEQIDAATYRRAGLLDADALALLWQSDAGNIDAALIAQELRPALRMVIRMFNQSLGESIRRLLPDCAVLSSTAMAAPAFVAATLGDAVPTYVRLPDRTLFVTRRDQVAPDDIVCGLAITEGRDDPVTLPPDPRQADLVLSISGPPTARGLGPHRHRRHPLRTLSVLIGHRVRVTLAVLAALLLVGTGITGVTQHLDWWPAAYLTTLAAFGGANPDLTASAATQVLQTLLTIVGLALVPVLTAAVVEGVVNARLARAAGGLTEAVADHVVVVGLGGVGSRVLRALHDFGLDVVAIDRSGQARGVQVARDLDYPVIIADASREETLRAASVQTCRALVVLSSNDVTNLETALAARAVRPDLRVVLRLFDDDFADRVQRAFAIDISRSVSYLAAPAFAAAMFGRHVIDAIPVRRRVLLVAELPVGGGSRLEGVPVGSLPLHDDVRLLAIRTGRGAQLLWSPPPGRRLVRTDRLIIVATRAGLGRLLEHTAGGPGGSIVLAEGL